jgi:hypothetical protein
MFFVPSVSCMPQLPMCRIVMVLVWPWLSKVTKAVAKNAAILFTRWCMKALVGAA